MPIQPGDVVATWADVTDLEEAFNYKPATEIQDGVREFVGVVSEAKKTISYMTATTAL